MIPTIAESWTVEAVEAAEAARCAAMIAGDAPHLRQLFSDDATWIHSSGQVDGREAFVEKIESGASRYLKIDRVETAVRRFGNAAIASGVAIMTALADCEPPSLRNRYVNVWALRHGRPVLVSAQSTRLP
jgi:uncharacterized protein (TIGR02246 family)